MKDCWEEFSECYRLEKQAATSSANEVITIIRQILLWTLSVYIPPDISRRALVHSGHITNDCLTLPQVIRASDTALGSGSFL